MGLELPEGAPQREEKVAWMPPSATGGGPEARSRMLRAGGFKSSRPQKELIRYVIMN